LAKIQGKSLEVRLLKWSDCVVEESQKCRLPWITFINQ
jgi:hypothetical protein